MGTPFIGSEGCWIVMGGKPVVGSPVSPEVVAQQHPPPPLQANAHMVEKRVLGQASHWGEGCWVIQGALSVV